MRMYAVMHLGIFAFMTEDETLDQVSQFTYPGCSISYQFTYPGCSISYQFTYPGCSISYQFSNDVEFKLAKIL